MKEQLRRLKALYNIGGDAIYDASRFFFILSQAEIPSAIISLKGECWLRHIRSKRAFRCRLFVLISDRTRSRNFARG